jgi:phytoene/squalene synthetase
MDELANSMGLFLQKTNITRDYLEDVTAVNPRIFYPKDIWYELIAVCHEGESVRALTSIDGAGASTRRTSETSRSPRTRRRP